MKLYNSLRIIFISVVLFSLFVFPHGGKTLPGTSPQMQDSPAVTFCVTDVPTVGEFPSVKLNFRAFGQSFEPIKDISDQNLRVSENGLASTPLAPGMLINEQGLGIDYYIMVDQSNRVDPLPVKAILDSFVGYFDDSKDTVRIVTNEDNGERTLYPSPTSTKLAQTIADYSTDRGRNWLNADVAIEKTLGRIESDFNICQRQKILILILGDESLSDALMPSISERAKKSYTKLIVFHAPNHWTGQYAYRDNYQKMAEDANGKYIQITAEGDAGRFIFNSFLGYRVLYSTTYRTTNGISGSHEIAFQYNGVTVPTIGSNAYTLSLLQPQITLVVPSIVTRTAKQTVETGYVYDVVSQKVTVNVSFPDGYPRKISNKATLIINQPGKTESRYAINLTPVSGDAYQFVWDLEDVGDLSRSDLTMKVELVDELNFTFSSPDSSVTVLSQIPLSLLVERNLVYVMAGVVFLLMVALIVMWRRMGNLAVKGREVISNVAGAIRKTIVGGGRRGKPLATLKVIDGPPSMIGQELKIFSESIKLGRDPQKADMTFYAPDSNSSVSGLHARIEKVNGSWRIVAVSGSGSETFVDDVAIPFNEPYPLSSGQVVRLGYLAQQPVVVSFSSDVSEPVRSTLVGGTDDVRRTQVDSKTTPANVVKIAADKRAAIKQTKDDSDTIFDEFRERK